MTAEQALQILNNATENLATTRSQHGLISQALAVLNALIQQNKVAMKAQKEAAEKAAADRVVTAMKKPATTEEKKD